MEEMKEKEEKRRKLERRIESEVFTREVILNIGYLMNKGIIKSIDFPISKGKEAYVFRATAGKGIKEKFLAVKIFMVETSPFKHMGSYIHGDPRFREVKKTKREIVYAWTGKEFRNLKICLEAGVPAPKPYFFRDNVLVMEFIGEKGYPAPLLKDVGPPSPKENFKQIVENMRKMYKNNLIHSDVSEYNILVKGTRLYLIDMGQGVTPDHPNSEFFLRRDIENVIRYFSKFGIVEDVEKIITQIKK